MIPNMSLEDVLSILGRVGTVTLRKGTNDVSATPGHEANVKGWTCEISLSGYLNVGGSRQWINCGSRNHTALQAAINCLGELEKFLDDEQGREARKRYEHHWDVLRGLAHRRARSDCFGGTYRDPGPMVAEAKIEWGD